MTWEIVVAPEFMKTCREKYLGTPKETGTTFARKTTHVFEYHSPYEWDIEVRMFGILVYKAEFNVILPRRADFDNFGQERKHTEIIKFESIKWSPWERVVVIGEPSDVAEFKAAYEAYVLGKMNWMAEVFRELTRYDAIIYDHFLYNRASRTGWADVL